MSELVKSAVVVKLCPTACVAAVKAKKSERNIFFNKGCFMTEGSLVSDFLDDTQMISELTGSGSTARVDRNRQVMEGLGRGLA